MTRMVNRYVVEPVDRMPPLSAQTTQSWLVWDYRHGHAAADVATRALAREALKRNFPQERIRQLDAKPRGGSWL
jgi:hypothetical protein